MTGHSRLALAAAIFLLWSTAALGATRTWTGGTPGDPTCPPPNPAWGDRCNWIGQGLPEPGDDLVLNGGSSQNTFPIGTTFNQINTAGHAMFGNPIALNAGLTAENAQISLGSIKLNNAQIFRAPTAGVQAAITSAVDTNGHRLSFNGPGLLTLVNVIMGTGGLSKFGSGTVRLAGPNSYTGTTNVSQGTLLVFGAQPASSINVADIEPIGADPVLGGSGTVGSVVFTFGGGTLTPGDSNNGTGILSINGTLTFPASVLAFLVVDLKGTTPGPGHDQVKTTGAVNLGSETILTIVRDPAFNPAPGDAFTIIRNDSASAVQGTFDGLPEGSFFVAGNRFFFITYKGGDGNDVVVTVPATWDGGGSNSNWTTAANWVGDVAPSPGDPLFFSSDSLQVISINDFPEGTRFAGLLLRKSVQVSGNTITLGAGGLISDVLAFFSNNFTLGEASVFDASAANAVSISGVLDLGPHTLTVRTENNGRVQLRGPVVGTGEIHTFGTPTGRLELSQAAKTSSGAIKVFSGDLEVVSTQISAPIILDPAGAAPSGDIDLNGTGAIGGLVAGGADVSPGNFNGTGVLTVNGGATFTGNGARRAALEVTLAGATANNQDKLVVNGIVALTEVNLVITFQQGFAPVVGSTFLIVANDGTDPIQGAFFSKPEGATFVVGGTTFGITYQGGDGNDIVLTVVAAAPAPTPTPILGNISTRLRVLEGENVLIAGMIPTTANFSKKVIIRAIGPTLTDFGLAGALQDPTLEVFRGNLLIASNDDWRASDQQADIENSGFAPGNDAESAVITNLTGSVNHTAIVRGKNGQTGIALVEVFDLDELSQAKLANISTRGFVDVDDNVMIAGVIVAPAGAANIKVVVRALGPTLGDFGVQGFLANPTLDLVGSNGTVIRANNDWKDDAAQRAEIEAAQLPPNHDAEAALIESLPPGAYTAVVRGLNRTTGVGLVEVYNIP